MAAIAPLNPNDCLGRKIGYSVGLENLLDNALELTSIYVQQRSLSFATWDALVKNTFARKESAVQDIANFFSTLNLIRIISRELHVLHGLDSLSVMRRYFADDETFKKAARFLLLHAILEADGDVFLSTLAGNFKYEESRYQLERMVMWKWSRLAKVFKNRELQKRIWDIVAIKSQGPSQKRQNAFEARKGPSPFEPRRQPFGEEPSKDFRVADSYLDKVLPTRKGWARDLLLFSESGKSSLAERILDKLPSIGVGSGDGVFFFWPYERDLARLRIDPSTLETRPLTDWELLQTLAAAANRPEASRTLTDDEVIDQLRKFHSLYQAGSAGRGQIRHQLPLFMAKPLIAAAAIANQCQVPSLIEIVEREARSKHRRLTVTNVRGTDGALIFSR